MSIFSSGIEGTSWVGQTMRGKYRIVSLLGTGGWGAVYAAEHLLLRRMVAIKVLHPDIAADPKLAGRFRREAMAASQIGHPNIVEVLDMDRTDDGTEFMVLELLKGESLGEVLEKRGALPIPSVLNIATQAASGLGAAHAAGIVHRDMKPDNVFLAHRADGVEFVKLLDFGIAKVSSMLADAHTSITQAGDVLGTPFYMPPEQVRGDKTLDHRADIFSLGVIIYEAIAGVPPFDGENIPTLVTKILYEDPVPLDKKRTGVPAGLDALVSRMLAKDPGQRPSSCEEILESLSNISLDVASRETDLVQTMIIDLSASLAADKKRAAEEEVDEDEEATMVMQSPVSDELASVDARALAAPLSGEHRGPAGRDPRLAISEERITLRDPSPNRGPVQPDVPSIVISDSVAKALPKPPVARAPENPPPAKPAAAKAPLPPGPPSRADATSVIRGPRSAPPPKPAMSNAQLTVLVAFGFTALMCLSYWVVSHL